MNGALRRRLDRFAYLAFSMAATERHVRRGENRPRRLTRAEQLTARASAAALAAREPVPGAIIDFRSVTKLYQGGDVGVEGVTFAVHPGEFVFIVGASGSGKSTTMRLLIKEAEPTSGAISVAGRDLSTIPRRRVPYYRRNIGVVFQDYKLLPDRTVYDNVAYALQVTGSGRREIREKVPDILRLTGLATKLHNLPDQLSGGEQQRVSVARAFVNHPPLLLADEPTGNLDPETSIGIMQLLYRINKTGTTVVVATHDKAMVDRMRRRVIELSEGHVVRDEQIGRYSTSETTGEFAARLRVETPGVGVEGPEADPTPRRLIPPEEEVG
jgi:cell division transport system ATP-binding protein